MIPPLLIKNVLLLGSILIENTNSPEWYIRGNAITSLGRLKLLPEKAVPIIINALDDNEGHDWTVRGSAIEALGYYADSSIIDKQSIISALETFRKKLKDEQDDDWIFQIQEVNKILKKLKSYHNGNKI